MMASNFMSRLLPSASDEDHGNIDHDDMAIDEENLGGHFEDQDLQALLAEAAGSEISEKPSERGMPHHPASAGPSRIKPKWAQNKQRGKGSQQQDQDDEVPASLMLEGQRETSPTLQRGQRRTSGQNAYELPPPIPGPATGNIRAQWEATKRHQQLHEPRPPLAAPSPRTGRAPIRMSIAANPKEKALWKWANVDNLDGFLNGVYTYYEQKGIWSMLLRRVLLLFSTAFGLYFSIFIIYCIDWSQLSHGKTYSDIRVKHCGKSLPYFINIIIFGASGAWIWFFIFVIRDIPRLWDLHNFYYHLLGVPDKDMQSITWQYVVACLMKLRDENLLTADHNAISADNRRWLQGQSRQRMDAHDIANRLMRKENYWIAMMNRDLLDCSIYIPFLGSKQFYTRTMEWNLSIALTAFVFNLETGHINPQFLTSRNRAHLVANLQKRFRQVALYNIFICPLVAVSFVVARFLGYFTEYQKNPAALGAREWTPAASWKLREFNELPHFFERRKALAKQYTDEYMDQFPRDKTAQLARFISFLAGSALAVLALVTLFDSELFLGFELGGRTILFWLGVLGATWNVTRGMIPSNEMVHDPEFWIEEVIKCTHYKPKHWEGKLYSEEVLRDMSSFYKLEIFLFLQELASVIFVPIVFWWRLPNCAEQIVDFFREFTIHVDGLGHVCSFAVFDFKQSSRDKKDPAHNPHELRADYFGARDNKLQESYATFMLNYGDAPRKGLRHGDKRGQFHLPPTFPGLAASRLHLAQSMHHTPLMGATGSVPHNPAVSPMQSVLLDPHHQPRGSHHSPRQGPAGIRQRGGIAASRLQALDGDPDEHDEDDEMERPAKPQRTPSNILEEDSDLGDSWAVKADAGINRSREVKESKKDVDGVGVLGLLYQFQKAQTEGRTGNI